ncbi:MAG: methyltransferase domain-containing protein [Clostridia bacterium]|nr:methyltransferase domain-containing protein [Clostridia bacterium]
MRELFTCPVCGQGLAEEPRRWLCPGGHSFDRAAEGYVHLLTPAQMRSKIPGDPPEMVRARRDFLASGQYDFLADALAEQLRPILPPEAVIFDAGCGEGHYTRRIADRLTAGGIRLTPVGVDIAKTAVRMAAKKVPEGRFAVASLYRLPVAEGVFDAALNIFSPLCAEELARVLKPGARLLYVVPAARHLYEMKEILYPEPYENEEKDVEYAGFRLVGWERAEKRMSLSQGELASLFAMTPYFWRSPREGAERLSRREQLEVTAAFRILIYEKKDEE